MAPHTYVPGVLPPGVTVSYNHAPEPLPDDEARELMATVQWYHRFELRPGLWTPGASEMPSAAMLDALGVPADLTGRRAIDVGAWDGPLTLELERRRAEAYALDIPDPTRVGLAVARRMLGSQAPHYRASVYELDQLGLGPFDHVVFKGVYYHLKYPVLAFEKIARALRVGGLAHIEGETALNHAEDTDGNR